MTDFIGWVGCITICLSMFFNPKDKLGNYLLRTFNLIGSICYMIHGYQLGSSSMLVLNGLTTILNSYYIIKECIKDRRN